MLHDAGKRAKLTKMLNHAFPHYTIFQELKESEPEDDIEIAFKTIYLHTSQVRRIKVKQHSFLIIS